MEYGCGQCMPCRINRRRLWTSRLVLESALHVSNLFVTLTYANDFGPINWSLTPRHITLWLKRLRKMLGYEVRYFVAIGS